MKILKTIYYLFFSVIAIVAVLLIISIFPIAGNYKVLVVQSGSMEPEIKTGSVVVVKPADDYSVGDIITFTAAGPKKMSVTHRITEIKEFNNQLTYITKGDANNGQDSNEVFEENIAGKVLFSIPYLGYAVHTAKQPYGFIAIVVLPAAIIIFDEIKKIKNEIAKIRQEKKAQTETDN